MTFLNPLDALIPKIPYSFFPDFWVWVTSESVSVGFWGSCQLSPLGGGGGLRPEGSIAPPPPLGKPGLPWTSGYPGVSAFPPFSTTDTSIEDTQR